MLKRPKNEGGLRLVDLKSKHCTILCQWVFEAKKDPYLKRSMRQALSPNLGDDIWLLNIKATAVEKLFPATFWTSMLKAWCEVTYFQPMTVQQVLKQFLWYNGHILVAGKPYYLAKAYSTGLKFIEDLWDTNTQSFLPYESIASRFQGIGWLEYQGLITAIPNRWI